MSVSSQECVIFSWKCGLRIGSWFTLLIRLSLSKDEMHKIVRVNSLKIKWSANIIPMIFHNIIFLKENIIDLVQPLLWSLCKQKKCKHSYSESKVSSEETALSGKDMERISDKCKNLHTAQGRYSKLSHFRSLHYHIKYLYIVIQKHQF